MVFLEGLAKPVWLPLYNARALRLADGLV